MEITQSCYSELFILLLYFFRYVCREPVKFVSVVLIILNKILILHELLILEASKFEM